MLWHDHVSWHPLETLFKPKVLQWMNECFTSQRDYFIHTHYTTTHHCKHCRHFLDTVLNVHGAASRQNAGWFWTLVLSIHHGVASRIVQTCPNMSKQVTPCMLETMQTVLNCPRYISFEQSNMILTFENIMQWVHAFHTENILEYLC